MTNVSQESYKKILAATSTEEVKALADDINDFPPEKWANRMFPMPYRLDVHSPLYMFGITS